MNPRRYAAYASVIELAPAERLLPSWFYLLAQRAVLSALNDRRFPYPAVGMVHLGNSARIHRVPDWDATLEMVLEVRYGALTSAGHRIDMTATFRSDQELVANNTFTAMVIRPDPSRQKKASSVEDETFVNAMPLDFPGNAGRRYAPISEDYNPIHLWPLTARLFGFRRPIAHGMFSTGRICALLAKQGLPVWHSLDVQFLKPLYLPAKAQLRFDGNDEGTRFELVAEDGVVVLRGTTS